MRIIVLCIALFQIAVISAFSYEFDLSSDTSEVSVWESFDITLDIFPDDSEDVSIDTIGWIEAFTLLGQSQTQRQVNINGQLESQTQFYFTLIPKTQWVFTLWPIGWSIWWVELQSNMIEITVRDENNILPWTNTSDDQEEDILDIFESTDRKLSFNYLPFLLWGFLIVFFILIQRFFRKSDKEIEIVSDSEVEISQHDTLIVELKSLKKVSSKLEKTDFYSQFNGIMRDFFSVLWYKNTQKMTLKEIQKLGISNKEILWIFAQSYRSEFDTKSDTLPERKRLIDSFIKQLQK